MGKIAAAFLLIGIPMALTQLLYRIIDRRGERTSALAARFPILKRRKFIVQILVPLLFIVIFGTVSILCSIPISVFFIVCGIFVGFINGMAVTLMYFCE